MPLSPTEQALVDALRGAVADGSPSARSLASQYRAAPPDDVSDVEAFRSALTFNAEVAPEGDLAVAAHEYIAATEALHVIHPSTAVHAAPGSGGIAGAAMTPHCAWQCNVVERVEDATVPLGVRSQSLHASERLRHRDATARLRAALRAD